MDITPIIELAVVLAVWVAIAFGVPFVKARTTAQQQEELLKWVEVAVTAAEQIYAAQGQGEKKKQYVLDWLNSRGILFDADKIDAMIESAVYEMKVVAGA